MKPFQIILLAVFALIALLGIFLFANFRGFDTGVKPVGTVVIWGTLPSSPINESLNLLKRTHPEYADVSYVERQTQSFDTDLAEALASGTGPDLILISQEQLVAEENKLSLIPYSSISERTFRDTYLPEAEVFLTDKGTFGIPFVIDPLMLYYNRTILNSAGVALPPSTWEAVAGLASALTRTTDAQVITRSGVALGTYDNIENAMPIVSTLFLQAGYSITNRGSSGVRSSLSQTAGGGGTTPADSALSFYTQFANPAKTVYSWNRSLSSSRQTFLAGDLALYFGFASEQPLLSGANPNLDFDMAPMPSPATSGARITYGRIYAFAIPKASKNLDGAYRIASSLTGRDVLPDIAHALHMAPAQRQLLIPRQGDIYEPVYFPETLIAKGWLSPAAATTASIFATMVDNVESGRQSVHDAVSTADRALDAALH